MEIIPITLQAMLTKDTLFIAIFVLAGIAAIEAGIIGGLATRVGSLRKLFRLRAFVGNDRPYNTSNQKDIATNNPDNQEGL